MTRRHDMAWYKWYPHKAQTSTRWATLPFVQKGFYHDLYDWAAMSEPASKRGWLYSSGSPMSVKQIANCLRCSSVTARNHLSSLLDLRLISRNKAGAYGFSSFARLQRKANLRPRPDSKVRSKNWGKTGATLGESRATEVEGEEEREIDIHNKKSSTSCDPPPPAWDTGDWKVLKKHLPALLGVWFMEQKNRSIGIRKYRAPHVLAAYWQAQGVPEMRGQTMPSFGKFMFGILRKGVPNDHLTNRAKKLFRQERPDDLKWLKRVMDKAKSA